MASTVSTKEYASYAKKEATPLQSRFADWLIKQTGVKVSDRESFNEGVRLATALRMQFQAHPDNKSANEQAAAAKAKAREERAAKAAERASAAAEKRAAREARAAERSTAKKAPAKKAPAKKAPAKAPAKKATPTDTLKPAPKPRPRKRAAGSTAPF